MKQIIELNGLTYQPLFPALLRPLTSTEFVELRKAVIEDGILCAIHVIEDGSLRWVIDGWHRLLIAAEFRWPTDKVPEQPYSSHFDDDRLRQVAKRLNVARRQLTTTERTAVEEEMRLKGMSLRAIAKETGRSKSAVAKDLAGVHERTPERIQGEDGKTYAAKTATPQEVVNRRQRIAVLSNAGLSTDDIIRETKFSSNVVLRCLSDLKLEADIAQAETDEVVERLADVFRGKIIVPLGERTPLRCPNCREVENAGRFELVKKTSGN